jgi:hypothetical protein
MLKVIFDVESVGLHGVGWVVTEYDREIDSGAFAYVEDLSTFESIAILSGGILPWDADDNAIAILDPKQRLIGE